jgi:hypothetical protein
VRGSPPEREGRAQIESVPWGVIANEVKQSRKFAPDCHGLRPRNDICRRDLYCTKLAQTTILELYGKGCADINGKIVILV